MWIYVKCRNRKAKRKKTCNKTITNTIKEEMSLENLPYNANKLYRQQPRTSVLYMPHTIHKPDNPGRPTVSAGSCPTAQIASFLDSTFTLINQQLPKFIKDTSHALCLYKEFKFTALNWSLLTMDVKSLCIIYMHSSCWCTEGPQNLSRTTS